MREILQGSSKRHPFLQISRRIPADYQRGVKLHEPATTTSADHWITSGGRFPANPYRESRSQAKKGAILTPYDTSVRAVTGNGGQKGGNANPLMFMVEIEDDDSFAGGVPAARARKGGRVRNASIYPREVPRIAPPSTAPPSTASARRPRNLFDRRRPNSFRLQAHHRRDEKLAAVRSRLTKCSLCKGLRQRRRRRRGREMHAAVESSPSAAPTKSSQSTQRRPAERARRPRPRQASSTPPLAQRPVAISNAVSALNIYYPQYRHMDHGSGRLTLQYQPSPPRKTIMTIAAIARAFRPRKSAP